MGEYDINRIDYYMEKCRKLAQKSPENFGA
jgi:hypothetical protein